MVYVIIKTAKRANSFRYQPLSNQTDIGVSRMTKRDCTSVSSRKQTKINVGDVFTNNQGCTAKVVSYLGAHKVLIEYEDSFRYQTYVRAQHLRSGNFKNPYFPISYGIGFFGVGDFKGFCDGGVTPEYDAWRGMLRRCYSDSVHLKHQSYADCYVCDDWHDFQVFAEWYTSHDYYNLDYHLDKDIIITGNKLYSEETCSLVPAELNALLTDSLAIRGLHPLGVSYNKSKGKYSSRVMRNSKCERLGYFDCPNEAHNAYVVAKEAYVKEKALEWKGRIEDRVFNALMAWTVE